MPLKFWNLFFKDFSPFESINVLCLKCFLTCLDFKWFFPLLVELNSFNYSPLYILVMSQPSGTSIYISMKFSCLQLSKNCTILIRSGPWPFYAACTFQPLIIPHFQSITLKLCFLHLSSWKYLHIFIEFYCPFLNISAIFCTFFQHLFIWLIYTILKFDSLEYSQLMYNDIWTCFLS